MSVLLSAGCCLNAASRRGTYLYKTSRVLAVAHRSLSHAHTYPVQDRIPSMYYSQSPFQRKGPSLSQHNLWGHPLSPSRALLHTSSFRLKEETKVESSVEILKKESEKTLDSTSQKDQVVVKKTIWARFVAEVRHYYNGFKLLFLDVRICFRYMWKLVNGQALTRRERKQFLRTTADVFRIVPFSVFIIVPFMEFLLPVFIKFFPGMLPSTFKDQNKENDKIRQTLKVKMEVAKFLQDTIQESALERKGGKDSILKLAQEFSEFVEQMRAEGTFVPTKDIMRFSTLFRDDITLDSLSRNQLVALCKLLELPPIGTSAMLLFQLRFKLRQLKADDKMIQKEGLKSLSIPELMAACRARGMRALGVQEWRLRYQLQQWLDMHLNEKVPVSLLLLSRTMYLSENLSSRDQLKETIKTVLVESTAAAEVKIHAAEMTGEKVHNQEKLNLIKKEEAAIKKDQEEATELEAKQKEKATAAAASTDGAVEAPASEPAPAATQEDAAGGYAKEMLKDSLVQQLDVGPVLRDTASPVEDEVKEEEITMRDLDQLETVLETIAEERSIDTAREELNTLKEEVGEYNEDLDDLKEVVVTAGHEELKPSKASKRLSKTLNNMLGGLDRVMDELHTAKSSKLEDIEVREVKMKRSEELQRDDFKRQEMADYIQEEKDHVISINELVLAMKRLQKIPKDLRLEKVAQVLDEDKDGRIEIKHVLRVIQELGEENVKLTTKQMTEVIDLLKKEEFLQVEAKKLEKLGKPAATRSPSPPPAQTEEVPRGQ